MPIQPGDVVRPASWDDAIYMRRGFFGDITPYTTFTVVATITSGEEYRGGRVQRITDQVIVVQDGARLSHPYPWDARRFVRADDPTPIPPNPRDDPFDD